MPLREIHADVLVVGGGAAGVAAAVGAARRAGTVVLIERYGFLGGLATAAMVGTVCGMYYRDESDQRRRCYGGFPAEFSEMLVTGSETKPVDFGKGLTFLPYRPFVFRMCCDTVIGRAGVALLLGCTAVDVDIHDGKILAVHCLQQQRSITIYPAAVVDCSGDACMTVLAAGRLLPEEPRQAAATVFAIAGIQPIPTESLRFLVIREVKRAARQGTLPPECERLYMIPGLHRNGCAYFKLGLPAPSGDTGHDYTELERCARERIASITACLRRQAAVFADAFVGDVAAQIGIRTGSRPVGCTTVEEDDITNCRKYDDGVAIGVWPMERWDDDGTLTMTYFAENDHYDIRAGALMSADYSNLYFGGRMISASEAAIASARVIGTCLGTGWAAGCLAAAGDDGADTMSSITEQLKPK